MNDVEVVARDHLRNQRPVVRGTGQEAHRAPFLQAAPRIYDTRGHRLVPQPEQQNIGVVQMELAQGPFQTPAH